MLKINTVLVIIIISQIMSFRKVFNEEFRIADIFYGAIVISSTEYINVTTQDIICNRVVTFVMLIMRNIFPSTIYAVNNPNLCVICRICMMIVLSLAFSCFYSKPFIRERQIREL